MCKRKTSEFQHDNSNKRARACCEIFEKWQGCEKIEGFVEIRTCVQFQGTKISSSLYLFRLIAAAAAAVAAAAAGRSASQGSLRADSQRVLLFRRYTTYVPVPGACSGKCRPLQQYPPSGINLTLFFEAADRAPEHRLLVGPRITLGMSGRRRKSPTRPGG